MQFGVDPFFGAVAHFVPVVASQFHFGRSTEADLADSHQVVEPTVGSALQTEKAHDLVVIGLLGQPAIDAGHQTGGAASIPGPASRQTAPPL